LIDVFSPPLVPRQAQQPVTAATSSCLDGWIADAIAGANKAAPKATNIAR